MSGGAKALVHAVGLVDEVEQSGVAVEVDAGREMLAQGRLDEAAQRLVRLGGLSLDRV